MPEISPILPAISYMASVGPYLLLSSASAVPRQYSRYGNCIVTGPVMSRVISTTVADIRRVTRERRRRLIHRTEQADSRARRLLCGKSARRAVYSLGMGTVADPEFAWGTSQFPVLAGSAPYRAPACGTHTSISPSCSAGKGLLLIPCLSPHLPDMGTAPSLRTPVDLQILVMLCFLHQPQQCHPKSAVWPSQAASMLTSSERGCGRVSCAGRM